MAKKITINELAIMIAKEFNNVHKEFNGVHKEFNDVYKEIQTFRKENEDQHKRIRGDIGNLEFIATELVRKEEFVSLLKRVERIEAQLKTQ